MNEGCEYCNNSKHIKEQETDKIYVVIYGKILRVIGEVGDRRFIRDYKANYCIHCGRKL
jgi:hypothetical protein